MVAGKWLQIGGKWYYFYGDGKLAVSTNIDGYEVSADGVRKEKQRKALLKGWHMAR